MTIDWWTLGLEAVNVAVLMWLLARFFWRPLAGMIEQRRVAAAKELTEAAAQRAEADKALAEIAATRAGLAKEREAMLVTAAGEADREHAVRLADATKEIEVLRTAAHAAISRQKTEASKAWREQAAKLAVDIAGRLTARLDGAALMDYFLDGVVLGLQQLPEAQSRGLASEAVELISAHALNLEEQSHCCGRLTTALGRAPALSFGVDPTLIAGLALHGPNIVIANNWRSDLDRILAELSHDA